MVSRKGSQALAWDFVPGLVRRRLPLKNRWTSHWPVLPVLEPGLSLEHNDLRLTPSRSLTHSLDTLPFEKEWCFLGECRFAD